jgi:hypothetical protein
MSDIVAEIGDVPKKGERIILHNTLWNDKPLCQSIPGKYWSVKLTAWTYPVSWTTCAVLRSTFGVRLQIGPELTAWAQSKRSEMDKALRVAPSLSLVDDGEPDVAVLKGLHENV